MANTPEQEKVMNASADEFMQELRLLLVNSTQEQRSAIGQFVDLIQKHYMTDTDASSIEPKECVQ